MEYLQSEINASTKKKYQEKKDEKAVTAEVPVNEISHDKKMTIPVSGEEMKEISESAALEFLGSLPEKTREFLPTEFDESYALCRGSQSGQPSLLVQIPDSPCGPQIQNLSSLTASQQQLFESTQVPPSVSYNQLTQNPDANSTSRVTKPVIKNLPMPVASESELTAGSKSLFAPISDSKPNEESFSDQLSLKMKSASKEIAKDNASVRFVDQSGIKTGARPKTPTEIHDDSVAELTEILEKTTISEGSMYTTSLEEPNAPSTISEPTSAILSKPILSYADLLKKTPTMPAPLPPVTDSSLPPAQGSFYEQNSDFRVQQLQLQLQKLQQSQQLREAELLEAKELINEKNEAIKGQRQEVQQLKNANARMKRECDETIQHYQSGATLKERHYMKEREKLIAEVEEGKRALLIMKQGEPDNNLPDIDDTLGATAVNFHEYRETHTYETPHDHSKKNPVPVLQLPGNDDTVVADAEKVAPVTPVKEKSKLKQILESQISSIKKPMKE